MADFHVKRLTDSARLAELRLMVHSAFNEFTPPSGVLNETLDDFAARLRDEIVLVAEAKAKFIGSVFCARKGDALYLTRMAVLPAWRKRGVGRALMRGAEDEARNLGLTKLTLRVRQTLPQNRAYFEGFRFVLTGEGQDPGRTPYYIMARRLDGG